MSTGKCSVSHWSRLFEWRGICMDDQRTSLYSIMFSFLSIPIPCSRLGVFDVSRLKKLINFGCISLLTNTVLLHLKAICGGIRKLIPFASDEFSVVVCTSQKIKGLFYRLFVLVHQLAIHESRIEVYLQIEI